MKKPTTELGKVIAEAREKIGISQRELSRRANMDCAEVSRIEAGKRQKPNVLYLKGIADTLNLSMVDLMKLAGYNDIEINWGQDFTDRRSPADYQRQIKEYDKFYFDVLEENPDLMKERLLDSMKQEIDERHYTLYELLLLFSKKKKLNN